MYRTILTLIAALALVVPGASAATSARTADDPTIAALAASTPQLSTLLSLVKQAGLADELAAPGELTVFAPTNAAFANVPKKTLDALGSDADALKRVLLYHVLPKELMASELSRSWQPTLADRKVRVRINANGVRINNANVTAADIKASNGVVHLIDGVLVPPAPKRTIAEIAAATPQLSTLLSLVKSAGLADALSAPGALTVYAPTNAAFAKVPKATLDALAKDAKALQRVLTYHVVPGKRSAARVVKMRSLKTLAGPRVTIRVQDDGVRVNDAKVLKASIKASNGVVDLIDDVLIPPAN